MTNWLISTVAFWLVGTIITLVAFVWDNRVELRNWKTCFNGLDSWALIPMAAAWPLWLVVGLYQTLQDRWSHDSRRFPVRTKAQMLQNRERCPVCDFPLATDADGEDVGLCRAAMFEDDRGFGFVIPHAGPPVEWRERALTLTAALDEARRGLQWYRDTYPEADGRDDDEVLARIDAALAGHSADADEPVTTEPTKVAQAVLFAGALPEPGSYEASINVSVENAVVSVAVENLKRKS